MCQRTCSLVSGLTWLSQSDSRFKETATFTGNSKTNTVLACVRACVCSRNANTWRDNFCNILRAELTFGMDVNITKDRPHMQVYIIHVCYSENKLGQNITTYISNINSEREFLAWEKYGLQISMLWFKICCVESASVSTLLLCLKSKENWKTFANLRRCEE
jgi:hypothetical protein